MRAHSLCRVRQRVRKSSRVIVYSFAVTAGVKWVSLFLSLFRCFFAQTTTLLNRELTSVSFSKSTLTSFLSPLPPTTPDIAGFLPDSGRCELAVRQRFVGRSDPGVAALDQVTERQWGRCWLWSTRKGSSCARGSASETTRCTYRGGRHRAARSCGKHSGKAPCNHNKQSSLAPRSG